MSGDDATEKKEDKTQPAHKVFLQELKEATCPADFLRIVDLIMRSTIPANHLELFAEISLARKRTISLINNATEDVNIKLGNEKVTIEKQKEKKTEEEVPKLEKPGDNGSAK